MSSPVAADRKAEAVSFASALLSWYDRHARRLPWRVGPAAAKAGARADPYSVWLSEIMLQQTQVATVRGYYERFLHRWPNVTALAEADPEAVMRAWAGLGYYSRARNLKRCAETVAREHGGRFPSTAAALKTLPGIGEYTAAAIAAIAFDEPVAVIDGNVERVTARVERIDMPVRQAKARIGNLVADWLPPDRPGDFAQAMMDLGATLCTPRRPACALCPVSDHCAAFAAGDAEAYPVKAQKPDKPARRGAAFVIEDRTGAVFLIRRPPRGLLGGMSAVPSTDWSVRGDGASGRAALPFEADWRLAGTARHGFTHFNLTLEVWHTAAVAATPPFAGWWSPPEALPQEALPSLMKKVIATALPEVFGTEDRPS